MSQSNNLSDLIEQYIKNILNENFEVELRRQQIAEYFNVVPSQINYVIKTRFDAKHGYYVESKRGGGGYIRIVKLQFVSTRDLLEKVKSEVGSVLTLTDASTIIKQLINDEIIDVPCGRIILAAIDNDALGELDKPSQNKLRAHIFKCILTKLEYEN
ncbi:CtsR family transcriptional regulator [Xylocopilactobacillus apicola]|uniref:Transcriptional regulator CtsR n=1 Tax=Xylocopilactobacillus apicola TaxID=2932184 RepID=A0AAU9DKG9_9LACO|nr:CtsR family transcriptional regulator [Xylocopilactobacillus apicola]BDR59041.1 transcriptional regulator CtsR [Xylocopilactobacillus apicola]